MVEFFTSNWFQILTTGGLAVGWFVDRRKRLHEADSAQGSALSKMEEAYNTFVHDMTDKYNELKAELAQAKAERKSFELKISGFEVQSEADKAMIRELSNKLVRQSEIIEAQRKRIVQLEKRLNNSKNVI